jgi:CDP-paratose 2-epimerase
MGKPISLYGDGKQVRDILYVDDLLDAYDAAVNNISVASGQIYNVGGGSENTLSVWAQFGPILEKLVGHPIPIKKGDWRPGDQRIYISDIRKAKSILNWEPKINVDNGIRLLFDWVKSNHELFL